MHTLSIVVNANSSCIDAWPMFFGQLEKHYPNQKVYVFTDVKNEIIDKYNVILYNKSDMFRTQYLSCIKKISDDIVLYLNDDYILYDNVQVNKMQHCINVLRTNPSISCIRFTRGPNFSSIRYDNALYYLTHSQDHFFSQTASLWKRDVLEAIHSIGPDGHIGLGGDIHGHFESYANIVCRDLSLIGLVYYEGENKRGCHYDSNVFPYIASALVKGCWNLSEYSNELLPLLNKYKIDLSKRKYI